MTDSYAGLLSGGVLLGLSIAAPIGPVNIAMIQRGLREGFRGAFLLGTGSTVADLIYILLAYAGADPLSHLAWARIVLFASGALVMGWLGYVAIRVAVEDHGMRDPAVPAQASTRSAFAAGFGNTIVTP
jgi:threonine/homoserine/homoserine lactone efflux protein